MSKRWADVVASVRLEPLFPIGQLTPQSECPHKGKIRRGSVFCCVVCHESGFDHRALPGEPIGSRIDPNYPIDVAPTVYAPEPAPKTQTRKQKRAKQFLDRLEPSDN